MNNYLNEVMMAPPAVQANTDVHYVKEFGFFQKGIMYIVSILGGLGTGLQNYMAVFILLKSIIQGTVALSKVTISLLHALAISVGGVCSTAINCCMNVELLEDFFFRLTTRPTSELTPWERVRYWLGSAIFIGTGLLFGLTAFAFSSLGPLTIISIIAGIFVAGIMMIQELETWLQSFDDPIDEHGVLTKRTKLSLWQMFKNWCLSLKNPGKVIGIIIAIGNVLALSLLFTLGLSTFLTGVGTPLGIALIVSVSIAFTGGAFTEFYFYNRFIGEFCGDFSKNIKEFWNAKYSPLGLVICGINAAINGVLGYVGIMMVAGLLTTVGIAMPPAGVVIALAVALAVFAGLASFVLGLSFWTRNSKRLPSFGWSTATKSTHADKPQAGSWCGLINTLGSITEYLSLRQKSNNASTKKQDGDTAATVKLLAPQQQAYNDTNAAGFTMRA